MLRAIDSLGSGKAPGEDHLPGDLYRFEPAIWGPYINLRSNFTMKGHEIPKSWGGAIIIPIHKKGDVLVPGNHRPISLIDILQRIFCCQVLFKLDDWITEEQILSPYQAGFRKKVSTIDQVFRLQLIVWKYIKLQKQHLYVAFVELKAAFDLVPRSMLWRSLGEMGVFYDLVNILERLHSQKYAKVRWGKNGALTKAIPIARGV